MEILGIIALVLGGFIFISFVAIIEEILIAMFGDPSEYQDNNENN